MFIPAKLVKFIYSVVELAVELVGLFFFLYSSKLLLELIFSINFIYVGEVILKFIAFFILLVAGVIMMLIIPFMSKAKVAKKSKRNNKRKTSLTIPVNRKNKNTRYNKGDNR